MPREQTPWNLGRFGPSINVIAILWCAFITVIFVLPPNELVLWTMIAVSAALFVYWRLARTAAMARTRS